MAYALNNVSTADTYTDTATLSCPAVPRITVNVTNASVYASYACSRRGIGSGRGGEVFEQEQFLTPGQWIYDGADSGGAPFVAIRFRSGAAGVPAQVSAFA